MLKTDKKKKEREFKKAFSIKFAQEKHLWSI